MDGTTKALSLEEFDKLKTSGAIIIDSRPGPEVKKGYIPGALCIPLGGFFVKWVEGVVPKDSKIVVVANSGKEQETVSNIVGLGYSNVLGYLEGGIQTWVNAGHPVHEYKGITAKDLVARLGEKPHILDVRNKDEWDQGILEGAQLITLFSVPSRINEVPKDKPVYVHCKLGGRSLVAYSILNSHGYTNIIDIQGGIDEVIGAGAVLKEPSYA